MKSFPLKFSSAKPKSEIENVKLVGFFAIVIALLACGIRVEAQQAKKVPLVGILGASPVADAGRSQAIRQALRDLGYVEGQNIAFEERYHEGTSDRRRRAEIAAELVRLKAETIIAAGGNNVVQAAMDATKTIPIVMMGQGTDPVKAGFVQSLARPGGNVSGLSNLSLTLGGKRLELLKEAVPKLTRVACLYDPAMSGTAGELKEDLPVAAAALKLTVLPWEIRTANELDKVFSAVNKARPDGLYPLVAGSLMRGHQNRIASFALKSRLPTVWANKAAVEAGGLMSYASDLSDTYRLVAWYVDKILKGSKPADLPVQQPMKFEFVINLKTAKQIRLSIPPDLLARATRIIR